MLITKVLHDRELTSTEKVLFIEIHTQTKLLWHCSMTNDEIGKLLNLSAKTVSRSIATLYRKNYVTKCFDGNTRMLKTV